MLYRLVLYQILPVVTSIGHSSLFLPICLQTVIHVSIAAVMHTVYTHFRPDVYAICVLILGERVDIGRHWAFPGPISQTQY